MRVLPLLLLLAAVLGTAASRPQIKAADDSDTTASSAAGNLRPIIGILSLPGGEVADDSSYISAGYVKWIESAGARVVPIMYDLSEDELRGMFKLINGLLIPGGNYPLSPGTTWFKAAHLLFNLAKEANEQGVYFPIHGTCLGLQLLITLVSHDEYAISSVDAHDHPSKLLFTDASKASSFFNVVPHHVLKNFAEHDIAMHNHHYGLLPQALKEYADLGNFYNVLAYTFDKKGVKYVSILEAKAYPFTGLAFHPEKVAFEWTLAVHLPHARMAVDAAYYLAQAFVERARMNGHGGASIVEEDRFMLYNWSPIFSGRHEKPEDEGFFEQIYVFPSGEGYRAQRQYPKLSARLAETL